MRGLALLIGGCGVVACSKATPSDAAISLLEEAPEGCKWQRVEPLLGKTETITTVPGESCSGISIAWTNDGTRAIFGAPTTAWLWSGTELSVLPAPPNGGIRRIAFHPTGVPTIESGNADDPCQTYVLARGEWQLDERSRDESCSIPARPYTSGFPRLRPLEFEPLTDDELIYRLEITAPWAPPTREVSSVTLFDLAHQREDEEFAEFARRASTDDARAQVMMRNTERGSRLPAAPLPDSQPEPWGALRMPEGLVIAHRQGMLVFETKERRAFLPEDAPHAESVWRRGDHLLVLGRGGAMPRLYDARTGDLAWSAPTGTAASFWPKLASPK